MIANRIIEQYKAQETLYSNFTKKTEKLLSELVNFRKIDFHSISSRIKDIESLKNKIIRKANDNSTKYANLSEITDIAGVRIITYFEEETYKLEQLIKEEFVVDSKRSIDKGANLDPERFGYTSKHFIVKLTPERLNLPEFSLFNEIYAEIQVRTILQHAWAENEHDLGYKSAKAIPRQIKRRFARVASLLEIADDEFSRIRKELSEHAENVELKISCQDKELLLDRISLSMFIKDNINIRSLDREIIPNKFELNEPQNSEIDNRVEELRFNDIRNVGQLESAIIKYKDVLIKFAKVWINDRDDSNIFSFGISLFYLSYVILAEKNCEELTIGYLYRCGIGLDYERKEVAQKIARVYSEISGRENNLRSS